MKEISTEKLLKSIQLISDRRLYGNVNTDFTHDFTRRDLLLTHTAVPHCQDSSMLLWSRAVLHYFPPIFPYGNITIQNSDPQNFF